MADERDKEQFDTEGKTDRKTTGQQGQQSEFGQQQGQQAGGLGSQETMSGQTQGGSRSDTLTTDQSGGLGQASSGQSSSQGEGFIGSREGGSDSATGGTDFA
jgi:hypothetical protein